MKSAEQELLWAVQALAQPADVQPTMFPPIVVVADELALDFDHWYQVSSGQTGTSWSPVQRLALAALDRQLSVMSGVDSPELWLSAGCLEHQQWSEVRRLALGVLAAFGWPPGLPPTERARYVPGCPRGAETDSRGFSPANVCFLVWVFGISGLYFLMVFLSPSFGLVLQDLGKGLPAQTAVALGIGRTIARYWAWILPMVVLLVAGSARLFASRAGSAWIGWLFGCLAIAMVLACGFFCESLILPLSPPPSRELR
ncbi:MAG: hypothetical protein HZA54_16805 [Planctomycetes bacterium]|nr:hypothetical protein [Planctomycetota bacterium]